MDSDRSHKVAPFLGSLRTCQAHPASVFGTDGPFSLCGLKPAHRDETGPLRLELYLSQACKGAKYSFL